LIRGFVVNLLVDWDNYPTEEHHETTDKEHGQVEAAAQPRSDKEPSLDATWLIATLSAATNGSANCVSVAQKPARRGMLTRTAISATLRSDPRVQIRIER
jgi:hypothetical protein